MTGIVVDASVLVACATADGRTRRTLLTTGNIEFYAPEFVREELLTRVPKIVDLSGTPPPIVTALLDDLFGQLTIVPREAYRHKLEEAGRLVKKADAYGDEDYVALALALKAPIWTYDEDFHRIPEIRVVGREEVASGGFD